MSTSKPFTVTIPGFTIAGKLWGSHNLPPLLALHGWLDNANSFDLIAPYLAKQFHVIAIDLPGHGLSSHLDEGCHYHFIDAIFTVITFIEKLGLNHVHLLGHSLGACLASLIAGIIPSKINSMVLIEGIGAFSSPENSCQVQLASYATLLQSHQKISRSYDSLENAALARTKRGHLAIREARILCRRGVIKQDNRFYWSHDRRLIDMTPLSLTENQILSCLKTITTSTYLIWATHGFAFDKTIMKNRMAQIANLTWVDLPGRHHLHLEAPEVVIQHLVQFYDTIGIN